MNEMWMNAARRSEEMRAHGIAATGRVARDADGFTVYGAGTVPDAFRVWDDPHVGRRCTCERFDRAAVRDERYRCEHMLAVELSLDPPSEGFEEPFLERRAV